MNHLNFGVLFFYCIDATERVWDGIYSVAGTYWSLRFPWAGPGVYQTAGQDSRALVRHKLTTSRGAVARTIIVTIPPSPNVPTTKPIQKHNLQPVKTISRYLEIRAAFYTTSHNLTFIFPVSGSHLRSAFQPPSTQLKFGHLGPVCGPLPTTSVLP